MRVNSHKQVMAACSHALRLHSCVTLMHAHACTATLISICPFLACSLNSLGPSSWGLQKKKTEKVLKVAGTETLGELEMEVEWRSADGMMKPLVDWFQAKMIAGIPLEMQQSQCRLVLGSDGRARLLSAVLHAPVRHGTGWAQQGAKMGHPKSLPRAIVGGQG